jgi:elongator complex protein 3
MSDSPPGTKKPRRPRYEVTTRGKGTSPDQQAEWRLRHGRLVDLPADREHLLAYLTALQSILDFNADSYSLITRRLSRAGRPTYPKDFIRRGYLALIDSGEMLRDETLLRRLTVNPVRTLSGLAPVTVLTKPDGCPGRCIFCPDDVNMPRSYLSNEPGAMRALTLNFDPFEQVDQRIKSMIRTGHSVDKVELLILGGTWSAYKPDYQEWFVRRCFDALNGVDSEDIEHAHRLNETAAYRNTGLVIETRPDHITPAEVRRLRWLGVTRVQLGAQTLNDQISALNKRGEASADTRRAIRLLRGAGFKIAVHWMPNLLGATPQTDLEDFRLWWSDPSLRPDEMKIYPTGLIRGTELYEYYQRGEYHPYTEPTLADLLVACKSLVPEYCRLNRVMRDIPAPEIAAGVITSNLRQVVQKRLLEAGTPCRCIRCREVQREAVGFDHLDFQALAYDTDHSRENFLSAVTPDDRLAGFLRLSLPAAPTPIEEIENHAMIRQVQVYGPALALEDESAGRAQHQGIGRRLIEMAGELARQAGYSRLAVIAAAGTREYYRRLGFDLGELYMSRRL